MPHLTFQHSANILEYLDVEALFTQLHRCVVAWPLVEKNHVKSKHQVFADILVGAGNPTHAFLHCEVALFAGRPAADLHELRETLQQLLHQAALPLPLTCWISVELREIPIGSLIAAIVSPAQRLDKVQIQSDRLTYFKQNLSQLSSKELQELQQFLQ